MANPAAIGIDTCTVVEIQTAMQRVVEIARRGQNVAIAGGRYSWRRRPTVKRRKPPPLSQLRQLYVTA